MTIGGVESVKVRDLISELLQYDADHRVLICGLPIASIARFEGKVCLSFMNHPTALLYGNKLIPDERKKVEKWSARSKDGSYYARSFKKPAKYDN